MFPHPPAKDKSICLDSLGVRETQQQDVQRDQDEAARALWNCTLWAYRHSWGLSETNTQTKPIFVEMKSSQALTQYSIHFSVVSMQDLSLEKKKKKAGKLLK